MQEVVKEKGKLDASRRHKDIHKDGKKRPGMHDLDFVDFNKKTEMSHTKIPKRSPR